ncbi:MAG: 5' nucleotidase, NT5C type [Bacillota bacterium]
MSRIIGVDIDAVLTAEGTGEENIWHRNLCDYFDLDGRQSNDYDFTKAYNISEEDIQEFMATRGMEVFRSVPPRPNSVHVLTELKEKNYNIILVTARGADLNQITAQWLDKHQIPYDQLIHSEEKADICEQKDIELFIDDRLKNLLPIKERLDIPVLLMTMTHNEHYTGDIPRVHNWLEIKEKINYYFK